ncbi:MAG TPA: iron ABC transporter permease [Candidatus Wallbacteria bacterium]|nr:iron ABC transporter permease [Candidatus Wallbacteria bacterium]
MSSKRKVTIIGVLAVIYFIIFVFSFFAGNYKIPAGNVLSYLSGGGGINENERFIIFEVRLPRIVMASATGIALAVGGVSMQAIFKNPLVSPFVIGLSSGAALGAAIGIVCFNSSLPAVESLAFLFGIIAVFSSYILSGFGRDTTLLLLFGLVATSFSHSAIGMMQYFADPEHQLPALTFWMLGGFDGITLSSLKYALPVILASMVVLYSYTYKMNLLTLGDIDARSLGVNVTMSKFVIIFFSTLMVCACVSKAGVIGWIGLTVPHISRIILGPDNRFVFIASAIFGAMFLLVSDDLARTLTSGEIPVGIITSAIGAPVFAAILLKYRKSGWN